MATLGTQSSGSTAYFSPLSACYAPRQAETHRLHCLDQVTNVITNELHHRLGLALSHCSCVMMCGDAIYIFTV